MKVRALRRGYDGKQIRDEGDEFEFAGPLGSWMEPIDADAPRRGPGRPPKSSTNASSVDEVRLHEKAEPEIGEHRS